MASKLMSRRLMGRKAGMIQMFDQEGKSVACTVIQAEPSVITQIKTKANDGYNAIQLGFDEIKTADPRTVAKRCTKPLLGHYKKAGLQPRRFLYEVRVDETDSYNLGQEMGVSHFEGVAYVDVTGTSKGKGYQGVMKKYGFRGGPASHGSGFHRHAGSTGMRSSPGRCLPGGPRPSHMGAAQVVVQSLRVFSVDAEKGIVIVEGAIPGSNNGVVYLSEAIKVSAAKSTRGAKAQAKKK